MNDTSPSSSSPPVHGGLFTTTRWSNIRRAQANSVTALDELFTKYRPPLIGYLRRRGYPHDQAEDLVQGFCTQLIRRDFLSRITPTKGKFRTFLLSALQNHLRDTAEKEKAQKRGDGRPPDSLDETTPEGDSVHTPSTTDPTADVEFDREWARTLLDHAIQRLESECAPTGHGALCRALEPVLYDDPTAPSYRVIAEQLGMSEGSVKVTAHRIRVRLKGIIREEVRKTVPPDASGTDIEEELNHLIGLFAR